MSIFFYILAVSLQLTGALLLLLHVRSLKRASVIKRFVGKGIIYRDNNTMNLEYNEKEFKETYKTTILNKAAFGYLTAGYFMGVFAELDGDKKAVIVLLIMIITILILKITDFITDIYVKYSKQVNKRITNDEIEALGIEPDIENISNKEIEKMFE